MIVSLDVFASSMVQNRLNVATNSEKVACSPLIKLKTNVPKHKQHCGLKVAADGERAAVCFYTPYLSHIKKKNDTC